MRRTILFASLAMLPLSTWAIDTAPNQGPKPVTKLPTPMAEPVDQGSYLPPSAHTEEGPSAADRGPAQKYFVLASQTDNLINDPNAPITNTNPSEKIELDKNIRVPLVHDVQDDSTYKSGSNDSILFEIKYLNWGAVTEEQLHAREGHYFTITFVNKGAPADLVTRLEYRQVKSKAIVRSLEQVKPHVHGAARAYFAVVDKAYMAYGPVSAWRFTVLRGDTVVAEAKSFLW